MVNSTAKTYRKEKEITDLLDTPCPLDERGYDMLNEIVRNQYDKLPHNFRSIIKRDHPFLSLFYNCMHFEQGLDKV